MYVAICSGAVTQAGDDDGDGGVQMYCTYLFDLLRYNSRAIAGGTTCLICDRHGC